MQKLIAELTRLYLPPGAGAPDTLARRLAGQAGPAPALVTDDGCTRAIVLHFNRAKGAGQEQHWSHLCAMANAVQAELGLPAPAVSISGAGYDLWLSLDQPAPLAQVANFVALLHAAYAPEGGDGPDQAGAAPAALPPCPLPGGDKWAAFIHPDLGASFADEPALEIAPPPAGQAALLEHVHSISAPQFEHALAQLRHRQGAAPAGAAAGAPQQGGAPALAPHAVTPPDLLLKDATLDDIVRFLHARNIEPTFRHLLPK